jgi:hypothetical protein
VAEQYLLDSNVFIEAANRYYGFEMVPGFWTWLEEGAGAGTLHSITMVPEEVDYPAELVDWLAAREPSGFFLDISDPDIQARYQELAAWVIAQPFGPQHVARFLDGADLWIIAAARVHGATVVTQESLIVGETKKIKIPNVCRDHTVRCINTFEMLEELNAKF